MTRAEVRFSIKADIGNVVAELTAGAQGATLAIIYAGVAYDQAALVGALAEALGDVPLVGASTQGVSIAGRAYESDRFAAALYIFSDSVAVRTAVVDDIHLDPIGAGRALASQLGPAPAGDHTTLMFYDPLGGVDITQVLSGLAAGGYPSIYGGASGQPWGRMVKTYQYVGKRVYNSAASVIVLSGLVPVAELTHGAQSIGLDLTVTKADGNRVQEIDGRPALDVWCEQLGVSAVRDVENTANWALGVKPAVDAPYEGLVTRAPFGIDQQKRELVFQAAIPQGSAVQVCVRNQGAVLGGAAAMGQRLAAALVGRKPVLALAFECGARPSPFLGAADAEAEILDIQSRLPAQLPWLGMYAWGEIAPIGNRAAFHNYTFPLCILCEG